MNDNIILLTDSYKQTHHRMYPLGLEYMHSYFEPRSGGEFDRVVFFGLQYFIKKYLAGRVVTEANIDEAEWFCREHFGDDHFNRSGWEHILRHYDGRLPVDIWAVPEGAVVPEGNVLFTIMNTDPVVPWLTNHLETLLVQVWYSTTVATISFHLRQMLSRALQKSGTPENIESRLHDFGLRGSTSIESAALGGAAHLLNFIGTDNIPACRLLQQYYSDIGETFMPGYSVPASEHSTITSWGEQHEVDAYRHIIERYPKGIVSVVSDSWDIFRAIQKIWGDELHDAVLARNGTVVIRPDSGDPLANLLRILATLGAKFDVRINSKGYRVLPDQLRLLQGDGITRESLPHIVDGLLEAGWSLDNVVFGSGGGLLQSCNRDTQRFAFKCSFVQVDGDPRAVWKKPASDLTKASKSGVLSLWKHAGKYTTCGEVAPVTPFGFERGVLQHVFHNGMITKHLRLEDIRQELLSY